MLDEEFTPSMESPNWINPLVRFFFLGFWEILGLGLHSTVL